MEACGGRNENRTVFILERRIERVLRVEALLERHVFKLREPRRGQRAGLHHVVAWLRKARLLRAYAGRLTAQLPMPKATIYLTDVRDVAPAASQGFTRLTIRGRIHTLPRHVASEAEHERVLAPCSRDFQLLAAKQV